VRSLSRKGVVAALLVTSTARADLSTLSQPSAQPAAACRELHDFRFPTHMGADGVPDAIIVRTFDAEGRVASEDWQRDDAPHRTATFHYNKAGKLDREVLHLDDGKTVEVKTHRYDRSGREIEIGIDENSDGKADWLTIMTYDSRGRLATMRENVKAGTHRHGIGHWYHYDANDRLTLETVDNDEDGIANFETVYRYDERGLLVEKRSRWYDGTTGDAFTYEYDNARRLIVETDNLGFTWVHHYDDSGHLIEKVRELPKQVPDRTPIMRITYDYHCR
jgi:YD repeat-containing protein